MPKTLDPRDTQGGQDIGKPIRGPWLSGLAKGADDERRKPPPLPRPHGERSFWAKITSNQGSGEYEFEAQHLPVWDAGITWLTPNLGNFHPRTGTCYEVNANDDVDDDTLVCIHETRGHDGLPFYCFFFRPVTPPAGFTSFEAGVAVPQVSAAVKYPRLYYDDGSLDDEVRVLYAFEYDGDVAQAKTFDYGMLLTFGGILPGLEWENSPTPETNLNLKFNWITASWDKDTVDWAGLPATGAQRAVFDLYLKPRDADESVWGMFGNHAVYDLVTAVSGTVYGIVLSAEITNPPGSGYFRGGWFAMPYPYWIYPSYLEGSFS